MVRKLLSLGLVILSFQLSAQNALDFDGSNDYVQTTYSGVTGSADRTFEAWVYIASTPSGNTAILDYGTNAVGSRNTFYVNANLQLGFISGGTNANISSSTNAVPTARWAHVAFVLKSSTGYLYVDGKQVGTGNLSTVNTPTGNTNLRIGERVSGGTIPFNGIIDEVCIWNVAKDSTSIKADMNTEFCGSVTNLEAYYKFNHGTAGGNNSTITTLNDYSGSSNHGTLNNFALSGSTSNWVVGKTLNVPSPVYDTIQGVTCNNSSYKFGTQSLDTAGTYVETFTTHTGCDSVVTLLLTVDSVDGSAKLVGYNMVANTANATYQWYTCSPWFKVNGETNQTFSPTDQAFYAVVVTNNGCKDTSACLSTKYVGIEEHATPSFKLFPNPSHGKVTVTTLNGVGCKYQVLSTNGQILAQGTLSHPENDIEFDGTSGLYVLRVYNSTFSKTLKLLRL